MFFKQHVLPARAGICASSVPGPATSATDRRLGLGANATAAFQPGCEVPALDLHVFMDDHVGDDVHFDVDVCVTMVLFCRP